ncbi:MAG: ATP-binding protein [Atopobiaceae bacterium]|nr:ATP-binding protein [Atopobiaceae bacterium]
MSEHVDLIAWDKGGVVRSVTKSCIGGLMKDLARTISAFSNGSGGTLVLGVGERKGFAPAAGFDVGKIQDALSSMCMEKLEPIVRPIMDVYVIDGAPVLVAEIPELRPKDKPCYVRASSRYGGSYIRTGDGDRRLTTYEVDRLMEEHRQPRHDERLVGEATMDDLDQSLLQRLLAANGKSMPGGLQTWTMRRWSRSSTSRVRMGRACSVPRWRGCWPWGRIPRSSSLA